MMRMRERLEVQVFIYVWRLIGRVGWNVDLEFSTPNPIWRRKRSKSACSVPDWLVYGGTDCQRGRVVFLFWEYFRTSLGKETRTSWYNSRNLQRLVVSESKVFVYPLLTWLVHRPLLSSTRRLVSNSNKQRTCRLTIRQNDIVRSPQSKSSRPNFLHPAKLKSLVAWWRVTTRRGTRGQSQPAWTPLWLPFRRSSSLLRCLSLARLMNFRPLDLHRKILLDL